MTGTGRAERVVATVLPAALGAGVFAVAFVHVVELAVWAGQPLWAALLIGATGEAMAIAAYLEIRYRHRHHLGTGWAVLTLVSAISFSGACNLASAVVPRDPTGHLTGDPHDWRPVMALWPVAAFALVSGMKATRGHPRTTTRPPPGPAAPAEVQPPVQPAPAPVPVPELAVPQAAPPPEPDGQAPRGQRRHALAELVANVPADDPRSDAALARDLAPHVGLRPGTARKYMSQLRTSQTTPRTEGAPHP